MCDLYQECINKWGEDAQIDQSIEELCELTVALIHWKRKKHDANVRMYHVITEIADVEIMMKQLRKIFGEEVVEAEKVKKTIRLRARLDHDD